MLTSIGQLRPKALAFLGVKRERKRRKRQRQEEEVDEGRDASFK